MGRALILSSAIGPLSAASATNALAEGWSERWQVAVLPTVAAAQTAAEVAAQLRAEPALSAADLVVVGCDCFDFATRGGPLVQGIAEVCLQRQLPCLVFALEVNVSLRELRTFGLEEAHRIDPGPLPSAVVATATRIAAGWSSSG
ncbi:MAG: glycerate kinase [Propionibacteriaceae bacterium]|jgi:glycerate kinase|nr:glycerate kinase [Propionibacteriaceae bacterium]